MSQPFAVGDVVKFKSGGEKMTVQEVIGNDVVCVWFDAKKNLRRETFVALTLEKYNPSLVMGGLGVSRA